MKREFRKSETVIAIVPLYKNLDFLTYYILKEISVKNDELLNSIENLMKFIKKNYLLIQIKINHGKI